MTTVQFSGLQQVYAHGVVVSGNYAYIDGSTDAAISGSTANGLDALFIKLNLLNASVVWQYRLGGTGREQGGMVYSGSYGLDAMAKGAVLFPQQDLVAFSFTYNSVLPGLTSPSAGDWAAIVILGATNSSFIRYACNVGGATYVHAMIPNSYTDVNAGMFAAYFPAGLGMYIYEVYLNGTTYQRASLDYYNVFYSLVLTPTELVCLGEVSRSEYGTYRGLFDMSIVRYSRSTWQIVTYTQFGGPGYDTIQDGYYDSVNNAIIFTGFIAGTLVGTTQVTAGNGGMVTGRYDMSTGQVLILTRFGAQAQGNSGTGISAGPQGTYIVSGVVTNGPYGAYDAVVCLYASDFSLISTTYAGSAAGNDAGSQISYPYVLLSTYSQANVSTGGYGVGPAIMSLDVVLPAQTTTTPTLATTSSTSKRLTSTTVSGTTVTASSASALVTSTTLSGTTAAFTKTANTSTNTSASIFLVNITSSTSTLAASNVGQNQQIQPSQSQYQPQ